MLLIGTILTKLGPRLDVQVAHEGPTWLDRVSLGSNLAANGFGADVSRARRMRAEFLRGLGIAVGAGDLGASLERLERLALARRIGQSTGQEFVRPEHGFRGRVAEREVLPSGDAYLRVVDAVSRRFTLVSAREVGEASIGEHLELRAGADGRLEARRLGGRSQGGPE